MPNEMMKSLWLFSPELTITAFLIVLFLFDAFIPAVRRNSTPLVVTIIGCASASILTYVVNMPTPTSSFSGFIANDAFGTFFRYLFFFAAGASLYLSYGSKEIEERSRNEFAMLLLCTTLGLSMMALATHFLLLYIGIETVSIVSFVLAGFRRDNLKSNEASLKYLVFGALSSGLMIYGISLIYGYTGSLQYAEIAKYLQAHTGNYPLVLMLALVLVYAGLAYKISAFPMHFWTPDVYEGAPTPVATFFSVGPKAAGFAAFVRILFTVLATKTGTDQWTSAVGDYLVPGIAFLSAATMTIGNLSAIGQVSAKRLLAYSSVAHVGYMLMGLVTMNATGLEAVLFYLVVYYAMNMGAFWVVSVVQDATGSDDLDAFRGMGWKMPVLGICMAIFLFSLTGIPFFAGFAGKFLLFGALIKTSGFLWLAVIGVLNSVVSLFYYSKILKAMWLQKPDTEEVVTLPLYHAIGIVLLAIPTTVLGLFFEPIVRLATQSLAGL